MPSSLPAFRLRQSAIWMLSAALALGPIQAPVGARSGAAHGPAASAGPSSSSQELDPVELEELLGHPFEFANREQAQGAAMEATRLGQLERAREILGDLLVLEYQAASRAQLANDDPAGALPLIKKSLAIAPRTVGLLRQKAEALLALARQSGRDGRSGLFVQSAFEDALRAFEDCPSDARTLFGQSQTLWWLNRAEESLGSARRAAALLRAGQASAAGLPPALVERYSFGGAQEVLAQAAYLAFADQARLEIEAAPEANAARADALYAEALAECDAAAAVDPALPDSWIRLANLELFRGAARQDPQRTESALQALLRGLELATDSAPLLAKFVEVCSQAGGPTRLHAELQKLAEKMPNAAATQFELNKARFLLAQATVASVSSGAGAKAQEDARELYRAARDGFGELAAGSDAARAESARGWQVIAQAGLGWVSFNEGDNGRAEIEFAATEELLSGGLRWKWDGVMQSGEQGLALLVARYAQAGDLERAGELSARLAELVPSSADYANNAGFFWRDAAVAAEMAAFELCLAARGGELVNPQGATLSGAELESKLGQLRTAAGVAPELFGTEAEKRLFRSAAERELEHARRLIEQSASHYQKAAKLAPEDVRLLNDTALVLVHYTHRELDTAEALLERATQLGGTQLAERKLDESERYALTEAWGDAFYNLGILYLDHRAQPERARFFFERSLEIGPPDVRRMAGTRDYYLPRCSQTDFADPERSVLAWGQPCP